MQNGGVGCSREAMKKRNHRISISGLYRISITGAYIIRITGVYSDLYILQHLDKLIYWFEINATVS